MDSTISEVVKASCLPLSIIIVGVGEADFTNMNILDADDKPLRANGKTMERDIVQFVPVNQFKNVHYSRLAKEVLAEVPSQFLSYMKSKGILPRPPVRLPSYPASSFPTPNFVAGGAVPGTRTASSAYGPPPANLMSAGQPQQGAFFPSAP